MSSFDDAMDDAYDKAGDPYYAEEIRLAQLIAKLEAENARLREALGEIVEWVERWTSGDHPVANVAKKALQQSDDTAGVSDG